MINANMKTYEYFTYGKEDEYGQKVLSKESAGTIKMAIFLTSQSIQENINYKDSQYVGLTHAKVDDSYVIKYGNESLKVLYVNSQGRYTQVYMTRV